MALFGVSVIAGTADARSRHYHGRHHHRHHVVHRYNPPYASIVVDVNSGKVMEAAHADSPRHPASLTKMMTLYLLFERLQAGKIKLSTEMPVSAHAASMAPTKLDVKPGQHLSVEDAIKAIVTKSANDAAVVIAEKLGGSEPAFARMMTAKARALGMMHTSYVNASGLPNDGQLTTARDQAILARALQDRFPQYFHYFSTRAFVYHGERMRNHNHLLGRVDGVDGIKTGFIRASGFNIAVDIRRHHRHLVVVVFGGRTARARDERVRALINDNIRVASVRRTAPLVVEGWQSKTRLAGASPLPPRRPPVPGSTAPLTPKLVKTVLVQPAVMHTASLGSLAPMPSGNRKLEPLPILPTAEKPHVLGTLSAKSARPPRAAEPKVAKAEVAKAEVAKIERAKVEVTKTDIPARARSGWMIQVGAFDAEGDAKHRLVVAQVKAKRQLGKADPFTEKIAKGDKSLFRARFAGLDRHQARAACHHLKRSDIPCLMLKN